MERLKALIISEYDDTSSFMKTALEEYNATSVNVVRSLSSGLMKFRTADYDLILISAADFSKETLELIKKIRDIEDRYKTCRCSIIVIAPNTNEGTVKRFIGNGASFLIKKPFSASTLKRRVAYSVKNPMPCYQTL